jgi:hypothetical protein
MTAIERQVSMPKCLLLAVRDLRLKGWSPGSNTSTYPYVAPHTAKIHTPIRRRSRVLRCPSEAPAFTRSAFEK